MFRTTLLFSAILLILTSVAFADPGVFLAGAAEADITPEVADYEDLNGNGRFDMGDPTKPFGFGDRIKSFVDGKMLVGNGEGPAYYIYDKLAVYALVLEDPKSKTRIALVNSDIYMLTYYDTDKIRSMVDPKYKIDFIVIASTHNHMGPDTLGMMGLSTLKTKQIINAIVETGDVPSGVNPKWFEKFRKKMIGCIEKAAANLKPAKITFAQGQFNMGRVDMREPHIMDPAVNVMAVDDLEGKPIATLIQWANHPEAVLLYGWDNWTTKGMPYDSIPEAAKNAWGHVFTAGFCGYTREKLRELRGGIPMYFNGAVGGMQTPLNAPLWDPEKYPKYPADTPFDKVPETILIPNDFRYAPVLGRELAKEAISALKENGRVAEFSDISFNSEKILVPLENYFFRTLASLKIMGYEPGVLYDDDGNVDMSFGSWIGGVFTPGVTAYTGKNVMAEISVVNIGPAQIINVPAEALPELIIGFPDDFISNTDKYFPENKEHHPHGADYKLSTLPLKDSATGRHLFNFGLSGGELGYVIPKVDFDPPHDIWIPPLCFWWICNDASRHPHYEESMAISSDSEPIIMKGLTDLLKETPVIYPKK